MSARNRTGECAVRISLASALVELEVVGGAIDDAKLSRSHISMEITRDAHVEAIKQRLQAACAEC